MFINSNLVYEYDGSFEGLLCCIFESYSKKEIPSDINLSDSGALTLFPTKKITTDFQKANRVLISIPSKISSSALELVQHAFLTYLPRKELYILLFLRMGYSYGSSVMNMLSNDVVNTLHKAVKNLYNESHLLKGFIRFSIFNNALVSEIEPKNYVLPFLVQHFSERYPEEHFLIYDKTHNMALIYRPYESTIIPIEDLTLPELNDDERHFQDLWRHYYKTIEIQGRHNPKCRMSHMPKRYWKYLTEFGYMQKSLPASKT